MARQALLDQSQRCGRQERCPAGPAAAPTQHAAGGGADTSVLRPSKPGGASGCGGEATGDGRHQESVSFLPQPTSSTRLHAGQPIVERPGPGCTRTGRETGPRALVLGHSEESASGEHYEGHRYPHKGWGWVKGPLTAVDSARTWLLP